jgi:OmcA/MtrC family decaheme c-type cytochrome
MNRGFFVRSLVPAGLALCLAACSGSDGKNGKSCTVKTDSTGASILACDDGTSVPITSAPRLDGGATTCTIQAPDGGVNKIVCPDGTEYVLPSSNTGSACTVVSNGDGTSTMTCPGADGGTVTSTVRNAMVNFANLSANGLAALDLKVALTSVTIPATGKPVVAFRLIDNAGGNVVAGLPPTDLRVALLKLVPATKGGNGTWVSYMAANATSTASTETGAAAATATNGALTDNGDGTYVYTFAKNVTDAANAGTTYDPAATHRFAMQVSQSASGLQVFAPVNVVKDFVPATGADVTGKADSVDGASCLECHSSFRAKAGGTGAFHGGTRYDLRFCVACHNDQRRFTVLPGTGTTPLVDLDTAGVVTVDPTTKAVSWVGNAVTMNGEAFINMPVFIHKLHMGEALSLNGGSYTAVTTPYEITYPQDTRNCDKCHRAPAAQAANFASKPSRRACGSCHDGVSFAAVPPAGRVAHTGLAQADDSKCIACHPATAAKSTLGIGVLEAHVAVAPPGADATNFGGTNTHTNAGWIPAAGQLPPGAATITYDVKAVTRDASKHPSITFRFMKRVPSATTATPVVFNTYDPVATPEMMNGFVNSPSVYFAYAIPQDGIKAPADFNMTTSAWIKTIWNGTAASTGTMTGPDATGYYTITLAATIPDSAVMLTGGVGYSYGTTSTQPLTETDLPAFPYGDAMVVKGCAAGQICGGLIVSAPDVYKVATDAVSGKAYTARRAIVSNDTCKKCHEQLGANPTFHAGQRNDGPTCGFCHNPNRSNAGWSVSSSTFIHGIHGAAKRTVPYTWQASCPAGTTFADGTCTAANANSYAKVTYPGILSNCMQCHLPGMYDFSSPVYSDTSANPIPLIDRLLMSTVAANPSPTALVAASIGTSPYVTPGTDYGLTFATTSFTSGTKDGVPCTTDAPCVCTPAAPCEASGKTLVKSPITAACATCHDSKNDIKHMQDMGGTFYGTRLAAKANSEMCMMCHGPGTVAAIADVHGRF